MILMKYYDRNARSFLQYFKETRHKLREEPIHQLRVRIKRMRAILELIEIASNGKFNKKGHFNLFSPFFNHAGNLREIQVNHLIIKKRQCNGTGTFEKYLRGREKRASKKLRQAVIDFDKGKFEKINDKIRPKVGVIDEKKIIAQSKKFVSREVRKIQKLRPKLSSPRDLHKIRILLKSTSAILKLQEAYKPNKKWKKWSKLKKDIKPLELLIGEWHDKQVLAATMKQYIRKNDKTDPEIGKVKKLARQIGKENKKTVKLVKRRLDAAFFE